MLGVYAVRGYMFVSPELADERRHNLHDPVESDESDIDVDDTLLDHAPNWANGAEADRRDGLRLRVPPNRLGEKDGSSDDGAARKKKKSKGE